MIWRYPRKKNLAGEIFLGEVRFSKFSSKKNFRRQKILNPARGSKNPSRGGGVDLNFRGVIKNRNRWGSTPPYTPLLTYATTTIVYYTKDMSYADFVSDS